MAPPGRKKRPIRYGIVLFFVLFTCFSISGCHPKTLNNQKGWPEINHQMDKTGRQDEIMHVLHYTSDYFPEELDNGMPGVMDTTVLDENKQIPEFHKIALLLKSDGRFSPEQILRMISEAFARITHIPLERIKVSKYEPSTGVLELYFTSAGDSNSHVLMDLSDVPNLSLENIQLEAKPLKILNFEFGKQATPSENSAKKIEVWKVFNDHNWKAWQLAVIIVSCLFAFFCISIIIVLLSARKLAKETPNMVEERQVVVQPVLIPNVSGVNVIQPENKDCYVTETDSEHTPSPCRSPLRIKGKGLLERRGSNASLTLDLNRSQENIHYGTPPKECSTEEFLLSAGHCLTRNQLRNSLKDVKALHSEFWEIPMNHPERVEVAGSGTKNRYKTILPNEATRVQIHAGNIDPLTCYINANYIRGYAGESKAYIATQGPMTHTVNDFWAMVWEQHCPIIVMITKLKEKLKVKCEPYVPDYQGHYGGLDVTVLKVIPRDGYTIRELLLSNGKERHCVYHVWYTAWPDHKTPGTAKQLLAMAVEVEGLRHNSNGTTKGPTVVHCSAGIGRTGCFIAVSIGIQQLLEENRVDILSTVCGLRLDRGGMVQTAEQYEFVYQSLSVFEMAMPDQSGE